MPLSFFGDPTWIITTDVSAFEAVTFAIITLIIGLACGALGAVAVVRATDHRLDGDLEYLRDRNAELSLVNDGLTHRLDRGSEYMGATGGFRSSPNGSAFGIPVDYVPPPVPASRPIED